MDGNNMNNHCNGQQHEKRHMQNMPEREKLIENRQLMGLLDRCKIGAQMYIKLLQAVAALPP